MKRLNDSKLTLLVVAFVVALVFAAGSAKADFTFGEPVNLGPAVNGPLHDTGAWVMPDGLSLYYWRAARWADVGEAWFATRATTQDPWESVVCLGAWDETTVFNKSVQIWPGFTTSDGLEVYFSDWIADQPRSGGYGGCDLWMMKRQTIDAPWGTPINLGPTVNSAKHDWASSISGDGLTLYFSSNRPGGQGGSDLWMTSRPARDAPWGVPANLGQVVNSTDWDSRPWLSADGLALFFDSARGGGYGAEDLYVTTRVTPSSPWGAPLNLGRGVNSPAGEGCVFISADGSTLYFGGERPTGYGGADIWQASVGPVVEFNWGRDPNDPALVAHWALDETQGDYAHDSAGTYDGFVMGGPLWLPAGGQVGGALQLDGIDDCVVSTLAVHPSQGPMNIFAWVKGGAAGQVVISEPTAANWLMADAEGKLMTELRSSSRLAGPLRSQTIITDGQWHRIGLIWDGSYRRLCVDDAIVAEDVQDGLAGLGNALYIGTGKAMEPGSFWSGLIDDVRIVDPRKAHTVRIQQDTIGFEIYTDHNTPDVFPENWAGQGVVDFSWQTDPAEGASCLYCTGIERYGKIRFGFWPRDMSLLVQQDYVLELWVRGNSSGSSFDLRFLDTKTVDPADHPWRMRWTISESVAKWDGQWHLVRLPLKNFREHGSWDNDTWISQQGKFDWSAVQSFEIVAEHHDWVGRIFWFDGIRVTK